MQTTKSTCIQKRPRKEMKSFAVMHANIDGFKTHGIDVHAEIIPLQEKKPGIICLNETKLRKGDKDPEIAGHKLLCRRDRKSDTRGGGIAVFARMDI